MRISRHLPALLGYLGTVAGVALVSLVMWLARPHLTTATVALMYLLAVFSGALLWGRGPAIVGSILAVLAFDYLFVPPLFTLTVDAPSDALSLVVFLAVTIVTSRLVARERAQARAAEARARESRALLRMSDAMADAGSADAALRAIAELAVGIFGVRSCAVLLSDALGALRVRVSVPSGEPCDLTREEDGVAAYVSHRDTLIPHESMLFVPVRVGTQRLGVLRIGPRLDGQPLPVGEHRLLQTFAAAAAVAMDRRRLQEAATQAEVLRKSDELKTALLNSVSHDLRTPLAAIKTGITALLDDLALDRHAQREVLADANEEVDRLTRLIGNLLDLSRIEAGALAPDRQWYEMGEVITDAVRRSADRFRDHHITTAISTPELPLCVDYVHIQQIVTNLLENAARYSPAGTEIHVGAGVEGDVCIVRVRDHGPGIPASEAERIFSKFYRIGRHRDGTGLGLAICRGLAEAHGGRVTVENPGQPGAVFAVSLPLMTPPALTGAQT